MADQDSDDTTLTGAHPVLPTGHVLAGRYRIESLAGVGGMGVVYRAHDLELDQAAALKLLPSHQAPNEETLQRFRRELILGRQISHPNVVRVHDIGHDGGTYFLSMDYVDGRPLNEVMDGEGPLPPERAAGIAAQIASALAVAHAKHIVHRDLKPSNILIDAAGNALITDFGIARSIEEAGLTRTGEVFGTPDYLAPEQARGADVDARADIYALGVMLYEMLSGTLPTRAESLTEKLAQRATGRTRDITETGTRIPPWLRKVLRHCLAPGPGRRYQNAEDLAADLRAREFRARPWRRVTPGRVVAALVLGVLLASGGHLLWQNRDAFFGDGTPDRPAIAVLPFQNQTNNNDLAWVKSGVSDMLTAQLAENRGLQVIDSLRVQRTLRDLNINATTLDPGNVRLLFEVLGTDGLVTGSVRSRGDGLEIAAQLLNADTNENARYFTADGNMAGALSDMTHALAMQIASALDSGAPQASPAPLSDDPEAMRLYSAGLDKLLVGDSVSALPLLERAVTVDSGFAAAWLRLSGAQESLGYYDAAVDAARQAVAQAELSQSHIALEARARAAALEGDFARAEELLHTLVETYPNDTLARMALARTFGDAGEFARASAVLRDIVAADPQHPTAWYLLGKYAILQGESRRAVDEYLVRALVVQNRLNNAQGRADTLNAMGIAYYDLGEFETAKTHYQQASDIRREIGDRRGVAATLTNIARLDALRGDYAAAGKALNEAMTILEALGDHAGVASLRNEFGVLEEEQGHYRQALEHFRAALRIRQGQGDKRALAESYNNVGYLYYLLGEYDNASVYAKQSLALYQQTKNREGEMIATQTIGQLELARGNWDEALKTFLASLEASRALNYPDAVAVAQGGMGRIAFYRGRYAAAAESYHKAFTAVEKIGDLRGMIEFSLFRAGLLLELRLVEQAQTELDRVETWLAEGGNEAQRAELYRLRSALMRRSGDTDAAIRLAKDALAAAERSHSTLALLATRLNAADNAETVRDIRDEADRLGHAVLRLEAREVLAGMLADAGEHAAAVRMLREAAAIVNTHVSYHRLYRLHALTARSLAAQGDTAGAQLVWLAAAQAAARMRQNLNNEKRAAFDALPLVIEIDKHAPQREEQPQVHNTPAG